MTIPGMVYHKTHKLWRRALPYEFGSSKWKGFMMGFPAGYEAAQLLGE
jgi:hypothetical protein